MARPSTQLDQRLNMRLDETTAHMLDELRRRADDLPGRSELLRQLIHQAAAAAGIKGAMSVAAVTGIKPRRRGARSRR